MEILMQWMSALVRSALKLVLVSAAAVFALSLLVVALVSVLWVLLKALLTGRKPTWLLVLQRVHQARKQFCAGGWHGPAGGGGASPAAQGADVVDVQAFEVASTPALGNKTGPEPR